MAKKIVLVLAAGVLTLGTSACNTVRGAAADVESVADAVDDAM